MAASCACSKCHVFGKSWKELGGSKQGRLDDSKPSPALGKVSYQMSNFRSGPSLEKDPHSSSNVRCHILDDDRPGGGCLAVQIT